MEVRLVKHESLDSVFKIYQMCVKYHAEKGFYQWDENYPTRDIIENNINNKELFGLYSEGNCLGVIALTQDEPLEYNDIDWEDQNGKHLIIHRLCMNPNHMGKGFARIIMDYSENYARSNGYDSIRLDTFSPNLRAIDFYSSLNYKIKGVVYFAKRKDHGYTCFEKLL